MMIPANGLFVSNEFEFCLNIIIVFRRLSLINVITSVTYLSFKEILVAAKIVSLVAVVVAGR